MKPVVGQTFGRRALRQSAIGAASVGLLFAVFVTVEMFRTWMVMVETRAIDHPQLVALREDLGRDPASDTIKQEIRRVELQLRQQYLTSDRRLALGAWLLLAGLVVFAVGTRLARASRPQLPVLLKRGVGYDPDRGFSVAGRVAVAVVTTGLIGTAVTLPILGGGPASAESARGVWPRFRGAGGSGVSEYGNVPVTFDARAGQESNIRWKTVVPMPGMSSPVVWNDRVYLTGAIANTREVYCFDALSGAVLWRRPVSAGAASSQVPKDVYADTGYAAPSPVTDGKHVWALFANGDVICLDRFGKQRWCVNLGLPDNMYGLAASPILWQDKLIVQIDQEAGEDGKDRSALVALRAADGAEIWRTPRKVQSSWPTPIPIETPAGPRILTCANPYVIAYRPEDGRETWRVECLEGDGGPSPVFADGLVFAVNIASSMHAIRPDGAGDVTASHVAWRCEEGLPDVCSPVASGGLLWMLGTEGELTCLDTKTGARVWHRNLGTRFYASPAVAGDRLYLIGRQGAVFVLAAGREFRQLGTGHLGEKCDTSPAFADGRIYIRGRRHLFCIEAPGS